MLYKLEESSKWNEDFNTWGNVYVGEKDAEAEVSRIRNSLPKEKQNVVEKELSSLKKFDLVLALCKNSDPDLPRDSYKKRMCVVYPEGAPTIENTSKIITIIPTIGKHNDDFDEEEYKYKVLVPNWESYGFDEKIYFNVAEFRRNILYDEKLFGVKRELVAFKMGELDSKGKKLIRTIFSSLKMERKQFENNY